MCQGRTAVKTIPHGEDFHFPHGKAFPDIPAELFRFDAAVQLIAYAVFSGHDVHERQDISVLIRVDGLVHGDILCVLLRGAEKHENFVFYASRSVAGKAYSFGIVKCVGSFNEADGADGNQIILIIGSGIVFFYDMSYQAQVVGHQSGSCAKVSLPDFF